MKKVKNILAIASAAFIISVAIYYIYDKLRMELEEANDKNVVLEEEIRFLEEQREHVKMVSSIAIEFNLSPVVVEKIYYEARQVVDVKNDWMTWRFVQTPEYFTYLLCSIITVESNGNPYAIGDGGKSFGFTQMQLATARMYNKNITSKELLDVDTHLSLAVQHFVYLLQEYNGNHGRAIISWNRGKGKVDRLLALGLSPENGYVGKVFEAAMRNNSELFSNGG